MHKGWNLTDGIHDRIVPILLCGQLCAWPRFKVRRLEAFTQEPA